jgi:hypothetical protein
MGVENFFVLDGIAALLGYGPKENRPLNAEIAADLKPVFVKDGVHYTEMGYRNLAKCTAKAMLGILDGSLRVQPAAATAAAMTPAAKRPNCRQNVRRTSGGVFLPLSVPGIPHHAPPPATVTSATHAIPSAYHARGGANGPPQGAALRPQQVPSLQQELEVKVQGKEFFSFDSESCDSESRESLKSTGERI